MAKSQLDSSPTEPKRRKLSPTHISPAPISALAARKAAALANETSSTTSASGSSSEDEDEAEIEISSSSAEEEITQRKAKKAKVVNKAAGRYFGGAEEKVKKKIEKVEKVEEVVEMEVLGEMELLEEEGQELPKVSAKIGRGKRQRREKSAFMDPFCASTFVPTESTSRAISWLNEAVEQKGILFLLEAGETLIIHGTYSLTLIFGSISIFGSIIHSSNFNTESITMTTPSSTPSATHNVFAPSSHPLPILESLSIPFGTKTNSLLLPSGEALDISAASTVVLITDLVTGIEGVEKVLAGGGLGVGNGMWKVENPTRGAKEVSGQSWRLILEPTPSLTSIRSPDSWTSTLNNFGTATAATADITADNVIVDAERFVALVEGPKRVGKSTFAKLLLNRLLDRYESVAYLDTDLGQPEFTTPGLVSLSVLSSPVLGPSFTHLSIPIAAHFIGSTSPANDPDNYLSAISALIATYTTEIEYPLLDDLTKQVKIRDRIPLIINTQGWIKGLGLDLLNRIKDQIKPTHLFNFKNLEENENWDQADQNDYSDESILQFNMEVAPASPLDSKWSAADLRSLGFISYFHSILSATSLISTASIFPTEWNFSTALVSQIPYEVNWKEESKLTRVYLPESDISLEQVLFALNVQMVGIVIENETEVMETETVLNRKEFPYSPDAPLPTPTTSRCLGLGIIRAIDSVNTSLHLLFPLDPSHFKKSISLVKGSLEIPLSLMLDFKATESEALVGIAGKEWNQVPYLTVETGITRRKKPRRNLMRRGQN